MSYPDSLFDPVDLFPRVIELIQKKFPRCVDYNVIAVSDKAYAVLLDKNDKKLGTISEKQLSRYWQIAEENNQ